MSPNRHFIAYLIALHLIFAGLAAYLLLREPYWLVALEIVFVASLATGVRLVRSARRPLALAAEGLRLIRDEEFTSRFRTTGEPSVDALIGVYNRMVDHLRTERVRLAEQHHFLEQVLAVSPSGIVILDFDRLVASVNPAAERLLDTSAAQLVGRPLSALDTPISTELSCLKPGETRVVGLHGARRVKCHHGTFIDRSFERSFLLVEELTEELRLFERAAYEKLIRVMSHEVNNSVAASNSLLHSSLHYAAELEPASRDDLTRALGIVITRTEQLNAFMRRFADVFRLPPPRVERCDIVDMLERIVRLLAAKPDAAAITWRWVLERPSVVVSVDPSQMEQALLNVVKNAIEAIAGGGTITIGLTMATRVTVAIEDTGPGLAAEAQANLFTPFFSTKPNGQGIGLTLVQEILAGHGFGYSLERTPEHTTRFTIAMPQK